MAEEKSLISIHPRAYNLIKSATITSVAEGLVELITNCDDSYQTMDPDEMDTFPIRVDVDYKADEDYAGFVCITDNARGMCGDKMKRVLTVVGEKVAEDFQRGFFSRGAKDVSAIAKVSFESITMGSYSKLTLYPDSSYEIVAQDEPVCEKTRECLGIHGCGTRVTMHVLHAIGLPSYDFFLSTFPKILQLRSIFASEKHRVTLSLRNHASREDLSKRLCYCFPEGKLLVDMIFEVPRYPDSSVHFQMFKGQFDDENPLLGKHYQEHGFLVTSGIAIHDILSFDKDFRNDPNLKYLFGSIHSDTINELLQSFDITSNDPKNPFLIINPDRTSGLNRKHPFVIRLMRFIAPKIREVLALMSLTTEVETVDVLDMSAFSSLAKSLEISSSRILEGTTVKVAVKRPQGQFIRNQDLTGEEMPRFYRVLRDFTVQLQQQPEATGLRFPQPPPDPSDPTAPRAPQDLYFPPVTMVPTATLRGQYGLEGPTLTEYTLYQVVEDALENTDVVETFGATRLDVVDEEEVGPEEKDDTLGQLLTRYEDESFEVVFKEDPEPYRYRIDNLGHGIRIIINKSNPILATFLSDSQTVDGTVSSKALVLLNDILTEAFSRLLLIKELRNDSADHVVSGDTPDETAYKVFELQDRMVTKVEQLVFEVTKQILAQRKLAKLAAASTE
jgi:hypothetical protein